MSTDSSESSERGWLVGERSALALLVLACHIVLCWIFWQALESPMVAALGAVYVFAFLGLAASWFFARWFALGVGWFGVGVATWWIIGNGSIDPTHLIVGGANFALVLLLSGKSMAADFEGRSRFIGRLKDGAILRLRLVALVLGAALPALLFFAPLGYDSVAATHLRIVAPLR